MLWCFLALLASSGTIDTPDAGVPNFLDVSLARANDFFLLGHLYRFLKALDCSYHNTVSVVIPSGFLHTPSFHPPFLLIRHIKSHATSLDIKNPGFDSTLSLPLQWIAVTDETYWSNGTQSSATEIRTQGKSDLLSPSSRAVMNILRLPGGV